MKNFWKMVLAVICGILLLNALIIAVISGLATPKTPAVPAEGVLKIDMSKLIIDEQSKETIKELKEKLEDTRQQNVVLARAVISQNCNEDGKVLFQGMVPADAKKLEEKIGIQLGDAQLKLNAVNEDLAFFKELIENNDIPDVADYTIKSFLTRVPSFFSKLDSATQRIENFYKLVNGIPVI